MASVLKAYGYGYGYGGYGDGYVNGYGTGCCGGGYGDGDVDGTGCCGDGGYGDGDVDGTGYAIGKIEGFVIRLIKPFGVVVVGCQARTIADWMANWKHVASENGVYVSDSQIAELSTTIDKLMKQ